VSGTPPAETPYKGLVPYTEEDAPFFFGRESEREIITANLMASRLTLFYGKSGVGKSSVLNAGIAHDLRVEAVRNLAEHNTPDFIVVVFNRWRDDPVAELLNSVRDAVARVLPERRLPDPSPSLVETLAAWTQLIDACLLIVLDQFEEYFLYHAHEEGEGTFAAEFPRVVKRRDLRVSFLLSIREDALALLDRFKGRIPNLFDNYLRISHLDRESARAAIVKPIEEYNRRHGNGSRVAVEPELVEAVLEQIRAGDVVIGDAGRGVVVQGNDALHIETPYLQLVMTRLWEEERRAGSNVLRLETLNRLGGAKRIIQTHLDATMSRLPPGEREIASRVFSHLVTPSGTKISHSLPDLAYFTGIKEAQLVPVLEKLTNMRGIIRQVAPPPDRPDDRRFEIFHDVLAGAILDWQARRRLQRERRRVKRLRVGIAFLVLVVAAFIVVAFRLREAQLTDRANSLAQSAFLQRGEDPELAILLAVKAVDLKRTDEGREKLRGVLASPMRAIIRAHDSSVRYAAFSPDGKYIATSSEDRSASVWKADSWAFPYAKLRHPNTVFSVSFSPDGRQVVTACKDGVVRVWQYGESGAAPAELKGHTKAVRQATYSPDGNLIASAAEDKTARLWQRVGDAWEPLAVLTGHGDYVQTAVFSPDGKVLLTASRDETVRLWGEAGGRWQELHQLRGHNAVVRCAAFSPDGALIATSGEDNTVKIWRPENGRWEVSKTLEEHGSYVHWVSFSPDGKLLATSSRDKKALIQEVGTWKRKTALLGHTDEVHTVAFSPDGQFVVTASDDMTARLWRASPDAPAPDTPLDALLGMARSRITRDFTPRESEVYLLETQPPEAGARK
jgi:WD40 repeat protein